uniref:NADAR domain-containing protein n=1 Tax=Ditylenchus dipsaci TaxID=166011 RepID=A0A915EAZ2_9BILA
MTSDAATTAGNQQVKELEVREGEQKVKQQTVAADAPNKPKRNFTIKAQVIKNTKVAKQEPFKPTPGKLVSQVVENTPSDMSTDDYKVDVGKIVCFQGKDHFLSTLYPAAFVMDENTYLSVEHYYQACKLFSLAGLSKHAIKLQHIVQPIRVKTAAKKILYDQKVSNAKVEQWKMTDGLNILRHAINYKFAQNPELSKKLLETGDAILAQAYDRDTFYACGADKAGVEKWAAENHGKSIKIPSELSIENVKYIPLVGQGRNVLGVICMNIRKAIADLVSGIQEPETNTAIPTVDSELPTLDSLSLENSNTTENEEGERASGD